MSLDLRVSRYLIYTNISTAASTPSRDSVATGKSAMPKAPKEFLVLRWPQFQRLLDLDHLGEHYTEGVGTPATYEDAI